ncbi:MAG: CBS domain-containing protein [Nitrospira sp.]|nr:CBS domain-containing protein [Nitrospira sp.]
MQTAKNVKDIMIGVFDYPHIPYWFSISQAIRIAKVSFINSKKYPEPMVILIFDEKYNLMGTLTLKDILKGLEPGFLKQTTQALFSEEKEMEWDTLFKQESKELVEKPVREIMISAQYFVEPNESVTKAAYIMIHHDLILLPVLENKRKLIGLVRMIEVFDAISDEILKE